MLRCHVSGMIGVEPLLVFPHRGLLPRGSDHLDDDLWGLLLFPSGDRGIVIM